MKRIIDDTKTQKTESLPAESKNQTPSKKTPKKTQNLPKLTGKQRRFLDLYLDYKNKKTFFNAMGCIREISNNKNNGTLRSLSYQYCEKVRVHINNYLQNSAFSDEALNSKLFELMNAKKTKFFAYQGKIIDKEEVEALDIQCKGVDMALKCKGKYKDVSSAVRPIFNINFGTGDSDEPGDIINI